MEREGDGKEISAWRRSIQNLGQELGPWPQAEMQSRASGPGRRCGPRWELRRGNAGRSWGLGVCPHRGRGVEGVLC